MANTKTTTTRNAEEIRDMAKDHWSKFTEEDLKRLEGMRDEFVNLVQQRYGYAKQRAETEVDRALNNSNSQIESVVQKLPGRMDRSLLQYPWVVIVTALGAGFALGFALKPSS